MRFDVGPTEEDVSPSPFADFDVRDYSLFHPPFDCPGFLAESRGYFAFGEIPGTVDGAVNPIGLIV